MENLKDKAELIPYKENTVGNYVAAATTTMMSIGSATSVTEFEAEAPIVPSTYNGQSPTVTGMVTNTYMSNDSDLNISDLGEPIESDYNWGQEHIGLIIVAILFPAIIGLLVGVFVGRNVSFKNRCSRGAKDAKDAKDDCVTHKTTDSTDLAQMTIGGAFPIQKTTVQKKTTVPKKTTDSTDLDKKTVLKFPHRVATVGNLNKWGTRDANTDYWFPKVPDDVDAVKKSKDHCPTEWKTANHITKASLEINSVIRDYDQLQRREEVHSNLTVDQAWWTPIFDPESPRAGFAKEKYQTEDAMTLNLMVNPWGDEKQKRYNDLIVNGEDRVLYRNEPYLILTDVNETNFDKDYCHSVAKYDVPHVTNASLHNINKHVFASYEPQTGDHEDFINYVNHLAVWICMNSLEGVELVRQINNLRYTQNNYNKTDHRYHVCDMEIKYKLQMCKWLSRIVIYRHLKKSNFALTPELLFSRVSDANSQVLFNSSGKLILNSKSLFHLRFLNSGILFDNIPKQHFMLRDDIKEEYKKYTTEDDLKHFPLDRINLKDDVDKMITNTDAVLKLYDDHMLWHKENFSKGNPKKGAFAVGLSILRELFTIGSYI